MKMLPVFLSLLLSFAGALKAQESPMGAWKSVSGEVTSMLLITPSWFTVTDYNDKSFISTYGGTWTQEGDGEVNVFVHFNTAYNPPVGQKGNVPVTMENGHLITNNASGEKQEWTRVDDGAGPLAGNWRITSRERDGKMTAIPEGPRKTLKMLTGTRFQWVAINTDTGEFFGTGGGTYTFENGTYTEKIEFFSRDSSRVGAALTFKGTVNGNNWDHSGLSSKGEPIHEVWSK